MTREQARKCGEIDCPNIATIWTTQDGWRCDEHKDATLEQLRRYATTYDPRSETR